MGKHQLLVLLWTLILNSRNFWKNRILAEHYVTLYNYITFSEMGIILASFREAKGTIP